MKTRYQIYETVVYDAVNPVGYRLRDGT